MTDTASLRIAINTGDVKTANSELDKLTKTSAKTEQSANKVTKSFNLMNTALSSVAAIALAKHFTDSADAMNRLDGRLKLATDSMKEFVYQQHALLKIAEDSHTPIQAITDLFIKLNPSMIRLGANTAATNQVVSNFSKGLTLGGAKAQESASAILQFGQAMGSGVLRGEEFNAILEASPKLMEYMAKGLGVPIGALRDMAQNGELTAGRVSNALLKMTNQINKDFATLPKTVGLAMVDFNTELDLAIQRIDKATGTTAALSSAINDMTMGLKNGTGVLGGTIAFVQDYSDVIMGVSVSLAVMYTATKAATLAEFLYSTAKSKTTIATNASTASMITNMGVTRSLTTAQTAGAIASTALGTAMKAVPFVAVASTVAILAASFFDAKNQSDDLADSLSTTADKLAKLSQAQLAFKRQNISLELQDATRQLTTKKLSAGATKGRSVEDQAEIDDLQDYVKQLKESSKDIAQAQTDIRNAKNGEAIGAKKIVAPRETAPIDKKAESAAKKSAKEAQRLAEEEAKIQRGYLEGYAELQAQQAVDQYELELSQIEDLAKRQSDSATALYEMTLSDTDKLNAKFMEINETSAQFFDEETLTKFYSKWQEEIEKVQDNLDFKIKIDFDTEGDFKGVSKIAKQMELLADETKQYEENKKKAGKNTDLLAKAEEDHTQNQIAGYANISGAMSTMFSEGSREAAAFKAVESGLAVVAGVRAIMTAGTGDPYTAIPRMVAMAAMVASTLQSIGIAFGGGTKITTSSDAFSAMQANEGRGSVLGDATAQSESIANSMEILGDLAKPEFRIMSEMAKSLESIDTKIGGVSSLLLRQGGFAFGEGYEGFDTGFKNQTAGFENLFNQIQTAAIDVLTLGLDKKLLGGALSGLFSGITSSILGGLFGKSSVSQSMTDSGIFFADALLKNAIEEFNGSAYQTIATTVSKKSWFKSSSSTTISTYFAGLDDEVERQFALVLSSLYDTTLLAGQALDTSASSIEDDLSDFVVSIGKISLMGKTGDQIQETISSIFGKISDDIALDVFPLLTSFQQVGEGLFETMTRVASGMEEAEYYINRLGLSFNDVVYSDLVNKQGDVALEALRQSILELEGTSGGVSEIIQSLSGDAEELFSTYASLDNLRFSLTAIGTNIAGLTSSMLYGAAGIASLQDATQSYIENYLTESEQVAYNTAIMTDAFTDLGLTIPTTKQGFTDLLKSIDVTTESGQDLYGRLILLSEGFNDLVESSDKIKSSLFENIQSFIDSISIKNTSDAPKAFSDFSTSFNSMIDAIANGSSDLLEVGNTALDNAQNYLNVVTATATSGRDVEFAKAMLVNKFSGVIAQPDTSLNTINNTLNNNNAVLVAELQSLKFELNSIKSMTINQTATQISTLGEMRILVGLTATA